jgi:putative MFS transporter
MTMAGGNERSGQKAPPEREAPPQRLDSYLRYLLFFIAAATLFEGYDAVITSMALPYIGRDFLVGSQELGFAMSAISAGTISAFFPVRLADRYGRRLLLLVSVTGYSLFTVLTAFSTGLYDFIVYQFLARALMVTEIGVAAVLLAEELPARYRGFGVAVMIGSIPLGYLLAALLFPIFVATKPGWRLLYLSGGAVLLVVPWRWRSLRETIRWQENRPTDTERRGGQRSIRKMAELFRRRHLPQLLTATSLWFCTTFWTGLTLFFPYYAIHERGWAPRDLSTTLVISNAVGLLGYALVGPLLEYLGRRPTVVLYFSLAGVFLALCFTAQSSFAISAYYVAVSMMTSIWSISSTISTEIFPTHIRATGNAVANNLLGRTGMALAPALVGVLSSRLESVGRAVAVLAPVVCLCIPVVWACLKETKGKGLEEINEP